MKFDWIAALLVATIAFGFVGALGAGKLLAAHRQRH